MRDLVVTAKSERDPSWSCRAKVRIAFDRAQVLELSDYDHDGKPVARDDVSADVLADLELGAYVAAWAEYGDPDGSDLEVAQEHLYSRERFA